MSRGDRPVMYSARNQHVPQRGRGPGLRPWRRGGAGPVPRQDDGLPVLRGVHLVAVLRQGRVRHRGGHGHQEQQGYRLRSRHVPDQGLGMSWTVTSVTSVTFVVLVTVTVT